MHEAAPALAAWSNFYVITGSSAAALTGLMFVVITLVAGDQSRRAGEGVSTFSSPTVVHFCAALFVSAALSAPWRSLSHVAVVIALMGLYGLAYTAFVVYRTSRLKTYQAGLDDWVWYTILPFAGYAAIAVAGIRLAAAPADALFALAGAVMLLIFIGIHNAWDVVTFLAVNGTPGSQSRTSAPQAAHSNDDPPAAV